MSCKLDRLSAHNLRSPQHKLRSPQYISKMRILRPCAPSLCRFRENKNTCGTFTAPADSDAVGDLIGDLQDNLAPTPAP